MTTPVILVDDDVQVLASLSALVEALSYKVESFESGDALLGSQQELSERIIFLDIRMPGRDGMEVLREIRKQTDRAHIVMMTGHGDVPLAVQAMKDGANDFLEKPFSVDQITAVFNRASEKDKSEDPFASLTPREKQVAIALSEGLANKQVAYQLGISTRTVEVHRARLLSKLGISSIAELVRLYLTK